MMIPPRSYPNCFSFCTNLTSGPEDTKVLGFAADYDEKANTTVNENDLLYWRQLDFCLIEKR